MCVNCWLGLGARACIFGCELLVRFKTSRARARIYGCRLDDGLGMAFLLDEFEV